MERFDEGQEAAEESKEEVNDGVVLLDSDGVPRLTTDADLDRLRMSRGVRDNSVFLQQDFLPFFESKVKDRLRLAATTEDLLRAQGMFQLLSDQTAFIAQKLKNQKGIV